MQKRYFNAIGGKDGTACILLYGEIGRWDDDIKAADIVGELLELESQYSKIDVRINSMGGEVFQGIAIFNALRNSKANITLYIDGVAASMGSVIAASRKPVLMSKYARLMIHSVSGGAWGNATEMERTVGHIKSLEGTLGDIYAERTGKTVDAIKEEYFDGTDHWFTADEALALGLIDGIYDAKVDDEPAPSATPMDVYNFTNKLILNKEVDMLKENFMKKPSFAGCATDEQVMAKVDHYVAEAGKVTNLTSENAELKAKLEVYENAAKEARVAEVTGLLDAAVKDGRINEKQRPTYQNLFDKDFENTKELLEGLRPAASVLEDLENKGDDVKSPWDERVNEVRNQFKK